MTRVSDEEMAAVLATTQNYCVVLLHPTPLYDESKVPLVVEHGRRNMELRKDGKMPLVFRIGMDFDIAGVGIFTTNESETRALMEEDPAVRAGIFTYEVLAARSFPGDGLPSVTQ